MTTQREEARQAGQYLVISVDIKQYTNCEAFILYGCRDIKYL